MIVGELKCTRKPRLVLKRRWRRTWDVSLMFAPHRITPFKWLKCHGNITSQSSLPKPDTCVEGVCLPSLVGSFLLFLIWQKASTWKNKFIFLFYVYVIFFLQRDVIDMSACKWVPACQSTTAWHIPFHKMADPSRIFTAKYVGCKWVACKSFKQFVLCGSAPSRNAFIGNHWRSYEAWRCMYKWFKRNTLVSAARVGEKKSVIWRTDHVKKGGWGGGGQINVEPIFEPVILQSSILCGILIALEITVFESGGYIWSRSMLYSLPMKFASL